MVSKEGRGIFKSRKQKYRDYSKCLSAKRKPKESILFTRRKFISRIITSAIILLLALIFYYPTRTPLMGTAASSEGQKSLCLDETIIYTKYMQAVMTRIH
jgi:hypothetical protein